MSRYKESYNQWLNSDYFDEETKAELRKISEDEDELKDRFYKEIEFGTAGLRGIIGAGTNRMNKYVIAKATEGLARYVKENSKRKNPYAVVGYDARKKSDEFAVVATKVLVANGIKVYLFDKAVATPELSYAVNYLKSDTGIMITASHNPADYNGYKVLREDGSQYTTEETDDITKKMEKIDGYDDIKTISDEEFKNNENIISLGSDMEEKYIEQVIKLSLNDDIDRDIKIVYTAMHGVGARPFLEVLKRRGFKNIYCVKEQIEPDGNFPTTDYPNPELPETFEYALKLGKKVNADIIISTDPDADRVAIMEQHNGEFIRFTGNQLGMILADYIIGQKIEQKKLGSNGVLVKTIVSDEFLDAIGDKYNIRVSNTLTGFKNIAEAIRKIDNDEEYIFGFEESIGYLPQKFSKDKDGISTAMLVCEMAGRYKKLGKTISDRVKEIYTEYGYYEEELYSTYMEGARGIAKMEKLMDIFREEYFKETKSLKLTEVIDYSKNTEGLKENVMKYRYFDNTWYAVRPSGTEPKIKFYLYSVNSSRAKARENIEEIKKEIAKLVDRVSAED